MNLREAWCRETSADPEGWTEGNPAWGQCAVTALVVQDILGGKLFRAEVNGVSHYWNWVDVLQGSPEEARPAKVDLTLEQFDNPKRTSDVEERTREYVLSHPDTVQRYELLKERLAS